MTLPPYLGVLVALGCALAGGFLAWLLMTGAFRYIGHDGYSQEDRNEKAARQLMERAKQGMRE